MIYDILPVNNYIGNNASKYFDFDFYIDNISQVKVYLFNKDNIKYELKYGIDYEIEGEKSQNGGRVLFPLEGSKFGVLSDNEKISIELDIPASQETQYNNSSLLNLKSLEYSFDYLTRLIQILKRKLSLCVKVEECSENSPQDLIESINQANDSAKNSALAAHNSKEESVNILAEATKAKDEACLALNDTQNLKSEIENSGMYKYQMFDTVVKDHLLSFEESSGFALQGTYVYKNPHLDVRRGYSDFYSRCLVEKEESTPCEVMFDSGTVTLYIHSNGHKFYDISDKEIIDNQYQSSGVADYYGIDIENERIYLPRNNSFSGVDEASPESYEPKSNLKLLYYVVGNTNVACANSLISGTKTCEFDTLPLGFSFYQGSGFKPSCAWLVSNGTWHSGALYETFYVYCESLIGRQFANGYVKNNTDYYTDYDFVINTIERTFRLPLKNGQEGAFSNGIPQGINLYFKVGNVLQNLELINIEKVTQQLSNTLTVGDKSEIISWSIPDYSAGIKINLTQTQPYIAPQQGVISFITADTDPIYIMVNGEVIMHKITTVSLGMLSGMFMVNKGDVFSFSQTINNTYSKYFFPLKGAK